MELTQFTDFSLRTLIYVGLKNGELASIREIASSFAISENHLTKVVHGLAKSGHLKTFRGRGGGITLGKAPEEIAIGELVRELENMAVVECLRPDGGACCIAGICKLQHALRRATEAFLAELDHYTLADLITNEVDLKERLRVS
ncbi:MAG: Rrf2 family transcriptional regulator [Verrucomicrobiales bacterium]|nr:Rrf2 family transcriptional regulator [Verrucomicrobiales bacterium]